MGDFTLRAMHAVGEQAKSSLLSSSGVGASYQASNWGAALSYAQFKSDTGLPLKAFVGGGNVLVGNAKINLSYGSHNADTTTSLTTKNNTLGVGVTLPLSPSVDWIATLYQVKRSRTAAADDGFNRAVSFLEYKLSKTSRLYAELDYTKWKTGYQAAGLKSTASGVSFGVMHSF
ncbi:MAG: porin [Pseudomonadota bacterium]